MNLTPAPPLLRPPAKSQWLGVGLAVLLFPVVVLGAIGLGVASYFHLSSDTRALRKGLMTASGVAWRQRIGLNVGSATLGVVRAGLAFAPLDARARAAVQAVHGVEVGIYKLTTGSKPPNRTAMFAVADKVLNARGWERVVGVMEGDQLVSVFVRGEAISARDVKCLVLVFDGRQLVVVSGRADVEPLVECLRNQSDLRAQLRSLATR